jgi:hypothetical protein
VPNLVLGLLFKNELDGLFNIHNEPLV